MLRPRAVQLCLLALLPQDAAQCVDRDALLRNSSRRCVYFVSTRFKGPAVVVILLTVLNVTVPFHLRQPGNTCLMSFCISSISLAGWEVAPVVLCPILSPWLPWRWCQTTRTVLIDVFSLNCCLVSEHQRGSQAWLWAQRSGRFRHRTPAPDWPRRQREVWRVSSTAAVTTFGTAACKDRLQVDTRRVFRLCAVLIDQVFCGWIRLCWDLSVLFFVVCSRVLHDRVDTLSPLFLPNGCFWSSCSLLIVCAVCLL